MLKIKILFLSIQISIILLIIRNISQVDYSYFYLNYQNRNLSLLEKIDNSSYVIVSTNIDLENDFYLFFLPITSLCWRRVGYEPIVVLVVKNKVSLNGQPNKIVEYLKLLNIYYLIIETAINNDKIIGMTARLFSALIPNDIIKDEDFVITSDTDLFPIKKIIMN